MPLGSGDVCLWIQGGVLPSGRRPLETATAADGTHPIGMHSRFGNVISKKNSFFKKLPSVEFGLAISSQHISTTKPVVNQLIDIIT